MHHTAAAQWGGGGRTTFDAIFGFQLIELSLSHALGRSKHVRHPNLQSNCKTCYVVSGAPDDDAVP